MATLAVMVQAARKAAGLTQRELGKRIGVSQSTINLIEVGETTQPSKKVREGLARVLGLSLQDLAVATEHIEPDPEYDLEAEFLRIGAIANDRAAAAELDRLPEHVRKLLTRMARVRMQQMLDTLDE